MNEDKVVALQASIAAVGLLQPIVITERYGLVAGRHRLEAMRRLGRPTIVARVAPLEGLRLELAEIDENLMRSELTVLQQADHLLRRSEILEALGERAQVGWNGNQHEKVGGATVAPPKTTSDLAAEMGFSKRSSQERLQIARAIDSDVKEVIAAAPIANRTRDLLDLARLDPEEQRRIVAVDGVKEGKTSVRYARRILGERVARARLAEHQDAPTPMGKAPRLMVGDAAALDLPDDSVDVIITSPPYNLSHEEWPMGGHGRVRREDGIGYDDSMDEAAYQAWQLRVLDELYRVARPGASLFYNHKTRTQGGALQHPMAWLARRSV